MLNIIDQEKEFKSLLMSFEEQLKTMACKIIEYKLCCITMHGDTPIYKEDHRYDPEWDCSGTLEYTGEYLSHNDPITLKSISKMYNGNTSASHYSGCGFFHDTYFNNCYDAVNTFLYTFCLCFTQECVNRKWFMEYIEHEAGALITEEQFEWGISDFATDLQTEFVNINADTILDSKTGEQLICDVYPRYELFLNHYSADYNKYCENNEKLQHELRMQADKIIVPKIFLHNTITKKPEDTQIREALENSFSEQELALLFGYDIIKGSNSYSSYYKHIFDTLSTTGHYPDKDDYLPENNINYMKNIIKANLDKLLDKSKIIGNI